MFKSDFPLLTTQKTVYLDSAASAQKPEIVLKTMYTFYRTSYANIHRGQCEIATRATEAYEFARQTVAGFLHTNAQNIVFTKGATESINLVASGYEHILRPGDEILVCIAEHHADFVPWQQVCLRTGAKFLTFDVGDDGHINMDDFRAKLSSRTRLVAMAQMSNVLGIVNPVDEIIHLAHKAGSRVLIDGAQGIAHLPVNVADMGCDYYTFSGHKIYGPTGIGVLYGTTEALNAIPPYQFGGDMIKTVSVAETTFADVPARFEAGTPPFVEAIGMAAAINYISQIGMDKIAIHEKELTQSLLSELHAVPGMHILGDASDKQGVVAFHIAGVHPADLAFILAKENICVRVGHHCAMPIHHRLGYDVSLRVSFGLYNDAKDIDIFMQALHKALSLLGVER